MNNKTLFNYVIGAVAGVGLTVGSAAFAVNTTHRGGHHTSNTMGMTTQQTTQTGMMGNTSQTGTTDKTTRSGMTGHSTQGGMTDNTAMQHNAEQGNGMPTTTQK